MAAILFCWQITLIKYEDESSCTRHVWRPYYELLEKLGKEDVVRVEGEWQIVSNALVRLWQIRATSSSARAAWVGRLNPEAAAATEFG
jgi:hypothetical protein